MNLSDHGGSSVRIDALFDRSAVRADLSVTLFRRYSVGDGFPFCLLVRSHSIRSVWRAAMRRLKTKKMPPNMM